MTKREKPFSRAISFAGVMALLASMGTTGMSASALEESVISYDFTEQNAGYAQGTITFYADTKGTYSLYWADEQGALSGYYPIETLTMNAGESKSVTMGYHTVIPAGAKKIIAVTDTNSTPEAVYEIPQSKQLADTSGELLYTFSAYSDIHIDKGSVWYVDADKHFKQGLQYAVDRGSDYIVVSGDVVTNDSGPDKEWIAYEKMLSQSDFVNPVWESDGNHDLRQGVASGIQSFITHSGTDSVKGSDKSYFYKVEEKTGDLFLFMSIELNKDPNKANIFSEEQLTWAENLIEEYTEKGVNVFLVQHAPIKGFGAGDRMSNPYYAGLISTDYSENAKFKELVEKYPDMVWLSGHTHEDFVMDYNYSDENNTAANMIHIPSLAGSTMPDESDTGLARNNGKGYNSQGYYTEVYENEIVFYGVNMSDQLVYPKYSYIMEGGRTSESSLLPSPEQPSMTGETADISETVSRVSGILSRYYKYASYDQYQALKKLYYQYKDQTTADKAVLSQFEEKITALSEHTGTINVNPLSDTYYFENNKSWSTVYGYAWNGSDHNAEWPGVKLNKVGTSNGNDVYCIKFDNAGQYHELIFNNGSSQTVDIELYDYQGNCFNLDATTNGKYNVSNYTVDISGGSVVQKHQYALLYYINNSHAWEDTSSIFTYDESGKCVYTLQSKSTENISFSLYDTTDKSYKSMPASTGIVYNEGETLEYALTSQSSRGKSITVNGLSKGDILRIVYDPDKNSVSVSFGEEKKALENSSVLSADKIQLSESVKVNASATGGEGSYTYAVLYRKVGTSKWIVKQNYKENAEVAIQPDETGEYEICVKVKDNSGTIEKKYFNVEVESSFVNNTVLSAGEITLGDTVVALANAEGGTGTYTYAVLYKKKSDTKWVVKQNYKENNTVSIKPAHSAEYDICVKVKDSTGTIVKKYFTVNVKKPALVNNAAVSESSVTLGNSVTIQASATGGTSPYTYAVYTKKSTTSKWTENQAYSENAGVNFTPNAKGTYDICVKVKDKSGTIEKKYFTVTVQ